MSEDSVTVMVLPDDDTETILGKVRTAGAQKVSLIVPPGTRALQTLGGFTMLRKACDITGIEVTVYSTDEKTADMAKVCRFDVVRLETEVRPREAPPVEEEEPRIVVSTRPPEPIGERAVPAATAAAVIAEAEEEPAELDERLRDLSEEDLALFDALESMSLTEDIELGPESFARPARPARAAQVTEPERAGEPARGEGLSRVRAFLGRILSPVATALGNFYIAVVGFALGIASRFQQRRAEPAAEARAPVGPMERTEEELRTRTTENRRYYLWGLASVVGITLLLVILFLLSLPRTTVSLIPLEEETRQMDLSLQILLVDEISPEAAHVTNEDGTISLAARTVQVELSGEESIVTSGQATLPEGTATGAVIFTNRTSYAVLVPSGTQLTVSGGGNTFHTTQDVTVPASDFVGSDAYIGKAQVSISADAPGSAGNVESGTVRTIQGDLSGVLYVINEMPTAGGSERQGALVTAEDQERLRQELVVGLQEEAYAELQQQIGELEVLSGTLDIDVIEETFSHAIGDEATTLALTARVRASALASSPGVLSEAIEEAVRQEIGEERAGQEIGPISHGALQALSPVSGISAWTYQTHASVPILHMIDNDLKAEVRRALRGLTNEEADQVMREQFSDRIGGFAISPVSDRLPRSASRIRIMDVSQYY